MIPATVNVQTLTQWLNNFPPETTIVFEHVNQGWLEYRDPMLETVERDGHIILIIHPAEEEVTCNTQPNA